MSFAWKEYLLLSQKIYRGREELGYEEAIYRCVVSRAYYSAFCGSRNFARDHLAYVPSNTAQDQMTIRDYFRGRGRNDIADKLWDLLKWRRKCDYEDEVQNIDILTKNAIKRAFEIFNHLDGMIGAPAAN